MTEFISPLLHFSQSLDPTPNFFLLPYAKDNDAFSGTSGIRMQDSAEYEGYL